MKSVFKKYKLFLIIFGSLFVVLLTLTIIPTNYDICVPARTSSISKVYTVNTDTDTDDIHISSVSVMDYQNVSVLMYLISFLNPYDILSIHSDLESSDVTYTQSSGTIQKNVSLTNALIASYKLCESEDIHISYEFKGFIIHSLYGTASEYFMPGDIIVKVNGNDVLEDSSLSYLCGTLNKDSVVEFEIIRDDVNQTINATTFKYESNDIERYLVGISTYPYYVIDTNTSLTYPTFEITSPSSYGPSAGLMQSLYLYECLTGAGLTKNINVVGTGTIDVFGNAGAIGGVEAKIIAASLAKADVFFVPSENYDDAYEIYKNMNTEMLLVSVNSLQDVVSYLENWGK